MYHGYPTCYDKQTLNTMLNKTMGDLYRETERWIEHINTCGYMYSIVWECQWDKIGQTDVEVMGNVDSYSLEAVLHPRDALYGGRCETFALHDQSTDHGLRIPLLTCHINGKVMFVLCRACAETTNCRICGTTRIQYRTLYGR